MDLLRVGVRELPKEEQEKIMSSIGESDISREFCLDILTKRLKGQKEFHSCLEKEFLIKFLRNSKFDVTKAFNRVKKFYECQAKYPEFFEHCSQTALPKSVFNKNWISPYRLPDNSILLIYKYFQIDLAKISVPEKNYLDFVNGFSVVENPLTQMCGVTVVADVAGFTLSKMFHYNLKFLRVAVDSAQGAFPVSWKNVHVINVSEAFKVLYNIIYPFMTKKIRSRFHLHTDSVNFNDLKSCVPPEALPEEYGGFLKQSDLINSMDTIYAKEEYFRRFSPYLFAKDKETKEL